MPQLATKLERLAAELLDPVHSIPPVRLGELREDLRRLFDAGRIPDLEYHRLASALASHLDERDDAIRHADAAFLEDRSVISRVNLGAALANRGRVSDLRRAVRLLADACEESDGRDIFAMTNFASALAMLGAWPEAREALDAAVVAADAENPLNWLLLARCASCVGQCERSVEYLARYLVISDGLPAEPDALRVIESAGPDRLSGIAGWRELLEAILRVQALRAEADVSETAKDEERDLQARQMVDATKPMRARATRAVLSHE